MKKLILAIVLFLSPLSQAEEATQSNLSDHFNTLEKAEKEEVARQIRAFKSLSPAKQRQLIRESNQEVEKAEKAFEEKKFNLALVHYGRALDLNPTNEQAQYRQAVSAFRNDDTDWAITYLNLMESGQIDKTEKSFFLGLSYYKLKKYEEANTHFSEVRQSGNPELAPSAAFYYGFYQFQQKNYALAKTEFQYVLDESQDPDMDAKAEKYIEMIISAQNQKERQEKKFFFSGMLGLQQDSNVLFSPDSVADQEEPSDLGGARMLAVGQARWRMLNTEKHELSIKTNLLYILSFVTGFKRADPFLAGIELPYSYKTKLFGKAYRLDFSPGYETLYLDANNDESRENILNTVKLTANNTFIMSKSWFASYLLSVRSEDSEITPASSVDENSALKTEISTTQTFVLDQAKARITSGSLKFINNNADGDNFRYNRIEASGLYTQKLNLWDLSWAGSLGAYRQIYPDRTDDRADTNLNASLTFSKPANKWLTILLTGGYTKNNSNVADFEYDKYTILLGASAKHSF